MNSWNQNQLPYNPYMMNSGLTFNNRGPVYTAAPIHGQNAAWQFPMGANSEIYLPDADEDIIWWIRTDNMGNRTVTPFDVTPHKEPEQVDLNDIVARLSALEDKIYVKQNKSNAKRAAAAAATEATVE